MRKLLNANFARLWKDKAFWCNAAVVLIVSLAVSLQGSGSAQNMMAMGYMVTLDDYFYNNANMMGLFYAIFVSLFLGTEYSDGTIRNKLLIGHRRGAVYAASFLTCLCAGAVLILIWMIGSLPGLFLVGKLEMGITGFAVYLLIALGFTAALISLFTLIASLSDNKALTVVFCLGAWLVLLLCASGVYDRLCEPELQSGVMLTVDGLQTMAPEPNPLYVSGAMRRLLECVLDFLPTGQTLQMSNNEITLPARELIFSLLFTFGTCAAGLLAFRRKDIK